MELNTYINYKHIFNYRIHLHRASANAYAGAQSRFYTNHTRRTNFLLSYLSDTTTV